MMCPGKALAVRAISSSSKDVVPEELRSLFKDDVKIQIITSVDILKRIACNRKSVIVVDLKLYEKILKENPDILKGCNVVINEGQINGKESRGSSGR